MTDGDLRRIEAKLRRADLSLRRPADEKRVIGFERKHRIQLPEDYRRFVLNLGDGGPGPPLMGLLPLGREGKAPLVPEFLRGRQWLPYLALPFPFTRDWIWEDGEDSDEGDTEQIGHGSLLLGDHGCGIEWRLIVTGPERGNVWQFDSVGIISAEPRRDFLGWYEDWLDGQADR